MATNDASSVKLSDLAYAKIAGRIRSGEFPINARLPAESDLAEMLGISRPVVREALARLRDAGVVISRRGSGSYVRQAMEPDREPRLTSIADMRQCLEYRISMEGEAAYHAAAGPAEHRPALTAAIGRLTADLQAGGMEVQHDFGFHLAVATATGSRFFRDMIESLRPTIVTAMGVTPSFFAPRTRDRLVLLHREHERVYDAIMANDREGARDAMRAHLTAAMRRVFDGVDQ